MKKTFLLSLFLLLCNCLQAASINDIATKYKEWLISQRAEYDNPIIAERYEVIIANANIATRNFNNYDRDKLDKKFVFGNKGWENEMGELVDILMKLSVAYKTVGSEDSPNPYYNNPKTLKTILTSFEWLKQRGWAAGIDLSMDVKNYQKNGFIALGGSVALSYLGYGIAVFVMEEELKANGTFDEELEILDWITHYVGPKHDYPAMWKINGFNTDAVRSLMNTKLCYILLMSDEDPNKEREMQFFTRLLDKALRIAPGYADSIKPDFVGYHHENIYANAYPVNSYHAAALYAYLLEESPYRVSEESLVNLSKALLTNRIYAQKYDIPRTVSGRFPTNLNTLQENIPAFAYLASIERNPLCEEMKAAFARLWNPEDEIFHTRFIKKGTAGRINYFGSIGALELSIDMANENVKAEADPNGYWFFPYGGMTIYRQDDWMVSWRGTSKYIWDAESPINKNNEFGKYNGAGVLQIYATGDPISAEASGYGINGWNWSRLPGTTTLDKPFRKLPDKRQRQFSPTTFLGGVVLNSTCGVSSFEYIDSYSSLRANKSLFFFDDYIYALGTDISCNDEEYTVQTTIAQLSVDKVNGKPNYDGKQYVDPYGHAYYFVDAQEISVQRKRQIEPLDVLSKQGMASGVYETCRILHGDNPSAASYAYVVEVNGKAKGAKNMSNNYNKLFECSRRDSVAHIVSYLPRKIKGYAIRVANTELRDNIVKSVDTPCILAIEQVQQSYNIVLTNPDMNRYDGVLHYNQIGTGKYYIAECRPAPVVITLNGEWAISDDSRDVEVLSTLNGETHIKFNCIEGKTLQASLRAIQ